MTVPLLLALLAWISRRYVWVVPFLVVAATIKYVPLLLVPLAAIACWRSSETWPARRHLAGWSLVGSTIVLLIALYPFYDLHAVRSSVEHQGRILRMSPATVAFIHLRHHFPGVDFKALLRLVSTIILLGYLAIQSLLVWRRPSGLPRAMFEVLCIFLIFWTSYFNAWYLIWLVALASVLPWGWASWRMIIWTASGMVGYGFLIWIQAWWQLDFPKTQTLGVALMFVPVMLLMVAEAVAQIIHFRQGDAEVAPGLPHAPEAQR
jgi:hypothetical protein